MERVGGMMATLAAATIAAHCLLPMAPRENRLVDIGWATHYNPANCSKWSPMMRGGLEYAPGLPVCAVDASMWEELKWQTLQLTTRDGKVLRVLVVDTGNLLAAGNFGGLPVVVDLPDLVHRQLSPDGNTVQVWVERVT